MGFDDITNGLMSEESARQKSALTRSAVLSVDTDAKMYGQNVAAAKSAGYPAALANPAPRKVSADDLRRKIADYHALQTAAPVTARHLENPEVAKVADHEEMSRTEKVFSELAGVGDFVRHTVNMVATLPADAGSFLGSVVDSVAQGDVSRENFGRNMELRSATLKPLKDLINSEPTNMRGAAMVAAGDAALGAPGELTHLAVTSAGNAMFDAPAAIEQIAGVASIFVDTLPFAIAERMGKFYTGEHPTKSAVNAAVIDHAVETAKKSETRKHSPQVHKDHVADVTAGMTHVTVETAHVTELLERAETTPDAALSDPAAYHEAVLNGDKTVNIPIADVTGLAAVITPEDIKRMSVGKTPSVEAAEKAAEAEKAQEVAKKGAVELRPAVKVGEEIKVGEPGQRHTDIVKDAPEENRGFTLDGKTMLSREEAAAWLKENHPDLHAKLPEEQKTSLHSEGLWGAQGIDVHGLADETIGIKNSKTEAAREKAGLPPVEKESTTHAAIMAEGLRLLESGEYDPRLGARRIVENPAIPVSDVQQAALLHDAVRISNETDVVMNQLERAIEADDTEAAEQLRQRLRQLEHDLDTNTKAATYAGTSASRSLGIRRVELKSDYSMARVKQRMRLANGKVDPATGHIEVPASDIAEVEKLVRDHEAALADIEGAVEKAAQAEAQKFVTEAVKAEVKKTKRAAKGEGVEAKRKVLDDEFATLQKALDKVLNPNKLNRGVGPEVIPILVKMAKNRIAAGLNTVDGIVNSIHAAVGDKLDVTKREIRDAISGYGKESKPTKDVLTARLNEVKAQAKLISALEDIKKGERPKKGGSTHTVSEKVKELRAKVDQAMRAAGFKHSVTPEEHQAAALKAVKARLTNKIAELKKQILTGEQAAKKAGVKYDAEANALKATVDKLQALYDATEAGSTAKTEHRVRAAVTSLRRITAELARKIKDRDVAAKEAGAPLPETPELKAERALHEDLKKQYKSLVDSLKVPKDKEAAKRAAYSAHLDKVIADLEKKLETGDFSKKPANKLKLDPATAAKKEKADRLRAKIEGKIKEQYKKNRSLPEKVKDTVVETARFTLLTGVGTLAKLTMAAASKFGITPMESALGSLLEIIPPLKKIGEGALREGGGFKLSAEAKAVRSLWEHGQAEDAAMIWRDGLSKLNVQYGTHKIAEPLTILNSIGRLHKILKNPAHVAEFNRAADYIASAYEKGGSDLSDPLVQALIHAQAHLEADRAVLMNSNMLGTLPKGLMKTAHDLGGFYTKAAVALSQVEFPIIKMAVNYANEVLSYTAGGLRAVPGLSKAAIKGIDKLTPLERDYILRNLKKSSVAAILATAVFSGVIDVKFGGYFSKDDKRVPGDLEPGEWSINGHKMPKILSHIPLFEAMQIFQTIKDISEAMRIRGEEVISRNAEGVEQGLYSIAKLVPFIGTGIKDMEALGTAEGRSKYFAALVTSRVIPPDVGNIAKYLDDNTPRQPSGLLETAESKIPGLRKNVPLDERAIKREIVGKLRNDEELTPYQQDMWDSCSPAHQEELEKEAEKTPLQVAFESIQDPHLIKSVKAWGILTDDERDQVRDIYDARVMRYFDTHDLTEEQLTDLNSRLDAAEERR